MKIAIILAILLLVGMAAADKYTHEIESMYKVIATDLYPDMGLLDVSANTLTGDLTIVATIDNVSARTVVDAVQTGGQAYLLHYPGYSWPNKAIIYVDKAGGTQIGMGEAYYKWIEDFNNKKYGNDSMKTYSLKVLNATHIWAWQFAPWK